MLRALINFALRFPLVVVLLAFMVLAAGGLALRDANWDVFPEFAPPQIVVQTEAPGFSTEEVERLVAVPVESALNGLSHLETLRSSSVPGLCVVTAIFEEGTDILDARQLVSERLGEVRDLLPDAAENPRLMPLTSSTSRLLMIGLTAEAVSPMELRTLADWTFRRRLQAVPGIAHVEVFGGEVKQYQVLVTPERLKAYGLSLDEVLMAGRNATGFGGAGFVETANQRLPIRQRTRIETVADIAAAPVAVRDGQTLSLGAVSQVRIGAADRVGSTTINGKPGVLLVIHKQSDFNTLAVTVAAQNALEELTAALPEGVQFHPVLFRQAAFIERAIGNLSRTLAIGCVLVAVVLVAFLFHWRSLAISLTAIPLSLLGAILVLLGCGASLNAMTLGGLAIALGEVVDDAIVDVENVLRRLKENRAAAAPRPALEVVLSASLEVRGAVVFASFIVMLVFLPVFFLEGLAGKFFGPLGFAYVAAILVSLVVALTVTPALCLLLLKSGASADERETPLVRWCNAVYRRCLPHVLRRPRSTLAVAVVAVAAAACAVPFLGSEFLPDFRESNFVVFMAGKPDSSLAESERMGSRLAERLLEAPGVVSVAQQIGRADLSEDTWGPNISEIWVVIDDGVDYDQVLEDMRDVLHETPGHAFEVKQFLRERIDEVLTGATADIVVRIVGPDLEELRIAAGDVAAAIRDIEGIADLRVEQQVDVPQIEVLLKPQSAARYGFSVGAANESLQALLRGARVGQVYEMDTVFDVVVRAEPEARSDPASVRELLLDSPTGEKIPVKAIADVSVTNGPNLLNREHGRRRIMVTCNAEGRDVARVTADIQRRLAEHVRLPGSEYHFEYAGESAAQAEARQRMLLWSLASLVGIFVLLYLDFRSLKLSLLVMLSVPLACVGGVASVLLSGGDVSLGSLVGFVTVFGVAVRNGILLISNYQQLESRATFATQQDVILHGSVERLPPILMTAATTALAIIPLVVAGDLPGHEIEHPMAVVIVGGLVSSTLLTLFVLPALYACAGRRAMTLGAVCL